MMRIYWYCERCGARGYVAEKSDDDPHAVTRRIIRAHETFQPKCRAWLLPEIVSRRKGYADLPASIFEYMAHDASVV